MKVGKITGIALALALVAVTVPMDDLSASDAAEARSCQLIDPDDGVNADCLAPRCEFGGDSPTKFNIALFPRCEITD